ncbi:hypothetical protein ACHAWU_002696 [Discostella pseudostelligera]|uniref:Uncharacterized protein n=1 Tax=Discostella pseudostelligera TaxID=259834 RepID=A0ABD3MW32_9STRA
MNLTYREPIVNVDVIHWDTTISSSVTVPEALLPHDLERPELLETANPFDQEVIETVCYTHLAEQLMVQTYHLNSKYYVDSEYFGMPGSVYFGAHNRVFCMTPAKHQAACSEFDPCHRPWFVTASSGPKDVVLGTSLVLRHFTPHGSR